MLSVRSLKKIARKTGLAPAPTALVSVEGAPEEASANHKSGKKKTQFADATDEEFGAADEPARPLCPSPGEVWQAAHAFFSTLAEMLVEVRRHVMSNAATLPPLPLALPPSLSLL